MSRPKPLVPIVPVAIPSRNTCPCTHADAVVCLARRHAASPNMVKLLTNGQGCVCACHRDDNGAQIAQEQWRPMKVSVK